MIRPDMQTVKFDNIPAPLREIGRWLPWRWEVIDGRPTKVPCDIITGAAGDWQSPLLWNPFDAVRRFIEQNPQYGLGLVIKGDLTFYDYDHVDGHPAIDGLIELFNSYTEHSPSGEGYHTIVQGAAAGVTKDSPKNPAGLPYERYIDDRWATFTGDVVRGYGVLRANPEAQAVYEMGFTGLIAARKHALRLTKEGVNPDPYFLELLEGNLCRTPRKPKQPEQPDYSSADLSLANYLYSVVGGDPGRIAAVMRMTRMVRPKWDGHPTYLHDTIAKAIEDTGFSNPEEPTGGEAGLAQPGKQGRIFLERPDLEDRIMAAACDVSILSKPEFIEPLSRITHPMVWQQIETCFRHHAPHINIRSLRQALIEAASYESANRPLLGPDDMRALLRKPPLARLMEGLFIKGGLYVLSSEPKAGKSTAARTAIRSVLGGEETPLFMNRRVLTTGPVLYYALEEITEEIAFDLDALGCFDATHPLYVLGSGRIEHSQFLERFTQDVAATGAIFAVVDPLIDVLGVSDINAYGEANLRMKAFVNLARQTGVTILMLHHNNKASDGSTAKSQLGSAAIRGSSDGNLTIQVDGNGQRYLTVEKRYRSDVGIEKTQLLLNDATGKVVLAIEDEATKRRNKYAADIRKHFLNLSEEAIGRGLSKPEIAKALGVEDKRHLDSALAYLVEDETLQISETKGRGKSLLYQRHPKTRGVLQDSAFHEQG